MIHAAVVAGVVTVAVVLVDHWTLESLGRGRMVSGFMYPAAQVTVDGQRRDQAEQQHAQQPPRVTL